MKKPSEVWLERACQILAMGDPRTRVMTIFVFYVNPRTPNTENAAAYGSLQIPGGIPSFFLSNLPSNAVGIMSGDPFLTRVMTIFITTYICVKVSEPY